MHSNEFGYMILYQNNSSDKIFEEKIELEMENLEVVIPDENYSIQTKVTY